MANHPTRRVMIGQATCLALAIAILACGQDSTATPQANVAPAQPSQTAPKGLDPTARAPKPSDPDLAPRLRQIVKSDLKVQRFARFWKLNPTGVWSNKVLGIRAIQNPLDAWVTMEIIHEVKPDFIVEAGTLYGGSAPLWAMYQEQVKPDGRVITIDIKDNVTDAKELPIWKRKVDFLVGSSTDPAIVADVAARVRGKTVMVILDSDHSEEHVFAELLAYSPMISVGSYLIAQDTCTYYQPAEKKYPGGCRAVKRFLAENDGFEIDVSRERFILTNNVNGYLRRVR